MTAVHRRAAKLERDAAKVMGGKRVANRPRFVRAPDIEPIRLASGEVLQLEAKSRKRLPAVILKALLQAERYCAGAVPVGVVKEVGGRALAVLHLRDLARLLGIEMPDAPERKVKPDPRQVPLFGGIE
jgi:hypothetical protein